MQADISILGVGFLVFFTCSQEVPHPSVRRCRSSLCSTSISKKETLKRRSHSPLDQSLYVEPLQLPSPLTMVKMKLVTMMKRTKTKNSMIGNDMSPKTLTPGKLGGRLKMIGVTIFKIGMRVISLICVSGTPEATHVPQSLTPPLTMVKMKLVKNSMIGNNMSPKTLTLGNLGGRLIMNGVTLYNVSVGVNLREIVVSGTPTAANVPLRLTPPGPLTMVKMKLVKNSMMKRMKTKNSITMKMKNGVTVFIISVCVISPMSVRGTGATANATPALSPPLTMVKTKYGTRLSRSTIF